MRIGLLLLCFYGLSPSATHASIMSTEGLSPDAHIFRFSPLNRLSRGDLAGPGILAPKRGSAIGAHSSPTSSGRSIEINPGADITVSANSPLVATGNISLLPRGNISLSGLAKKALTSATPIPRPAGGDITIWSAGNIDAGRGHLSTKNIAILSSRDISLGSGIGVPPISTIPSVGGKIAFAHGEGSIAISGVSVASVPLPASLYMLMTGVLTLASVSRRSLFRKA